MQFPRRHARRNPIVHHRWGGPLTLFLALIGGAHVATPTRSALAAPEPEPIPRRWQLRVEPGELRATSVDIPGVGPRAYFFLTYKVTNNTGEDRYLAPSFELVTDRDTPIRSGRGVPRIVSERIRASLKNDFLRDEIGVQGLLLQGEENAKEGLVIWPANDLKANEVTVYAAGFSGETKTIARPDNGQPYTLRKTLMLRHSTPGEIDPRTNDPLPRTEDRWILR